MDNVCQDFSNDLIKQGTRLISDEFVSSENNKITIHVVEINCKLLYIKQKNGRTVWIKVLK